MLESNPSAVTGNDVVLGRVERPCPLHYSDPQKLDHVLKWIIDGRMTHVEGQTDDEKTPSIRCAVQVSGGLGSGQGQQESCWKTVPKCLVATALDRSKPSRMKLTYTNKSDGERSGSKMELKWLKKRSQLSIEARRAMIEPYHSVISIRRQCALMGLNWASYYNMRRLSHR